MVVVVAEIAIVIVVVVVVVIVVVVGPLRITSVSVLMGCLLFSISSRPVNEGEDRM